MFSRFKLYLSKLNWFGFTFMMIICMLGVTSYIRALQTKMDLSEFILALEGWQWFAIIVLTAVLGQVIVGLVSAIVEAFKK